MMSPIRVLVKLLLWGRHRMEPKETVGLEEFRVDATRNWMPAHRRACKLSGMGGVAGTWRKTACWSCR